MNAAPSNPCAQFVDWRGHAAVALTSPDGATALILLQGAHLLSWMTADGQEQLYLSPLAGQAAGEAMRGGVPVIFPQFASRGPMPRHGFARITQWSFEHGTASPHDALAVFALNDNEATQALWPHTFQAELTVRISNSRLDVELAVSNVSLAPFEFTAALHTYLRVQDVAAVQLEGLHRLRYLDSVRGTEQIESQERLQVTGETDRIYFDSARDLVLHEGSRRRRVSAFGFKDAVVWNPGMEKCAAMPDMPPDGHRHMLCVESAAIGTPVRLEAGAEWVARQSIECLE